MIDSVIPFILAHLLLGYGLACLPPSSVSRLLILSLIVLYCLVSVQSTVSQQVPGLIGNEYVIGFILHASNFLVISKLSLPLQSTARNRAQWTLNQIFDARWGARYIPCFDNKNPKIVPSKHSLLIQRLYESACLLSLIYLIRRYPLNIEPEDIFEVPDGFLHRIASVTAREMVIRGYIYFTATLVPYCTLRLAHSIASILAVIFGTSPAKWPPLFGSLDEAYTIRRFYARFWHQLMRKAFTSHATYVVTWLLGSKSRSKVARYLILLFSFLIAALLHILASDESFRCSIWPQSRFYASIAFAIILEDVVIGMGLKVQHHLRRKEVMDKVGSLNRNDPEEATTSNNNRKYSSPYKLHAPPSKRWRAVGYCWVVSFGLWATSKLVYASATCSS